MTPPGLRPPPPTGASALAPATYAGRVVVVTGGGTGLGKSIATEFARLGAAVGILSRDEEHRAAGVTAVEEAGGTAWAAACAPESGLTPKPMMMPFAVEANMTSVSVTPPMAEWITRTLTSGKSRSSAPLAKRLRRRICAIAFSACTCSPNSFVTSFCNWANASL